MISNSRSLKSMIKRPTNQLVVLVEGNNIKIKLTNYGANILIAVGTFNRAPTSFLSEKLLRGLT